jgi:hypothetical protein
MINNREMANEYYKKVNQLVDEYIRDWGIKPSSLKNYLNPIGKRFNQFLARNGMNEITGADKVLRDVIEDRCAMESDGVLTFENFNFRLDSESKVKFDLFKGIENSELGHEKSISNYFDIDLSAIDIVDSTKHLFKIEDWDGNDLYVIVFDEEDIELIKFNLMESVLKQSSSELKELVPGVKMKFSEIIDEKKLKEKLDNQLTEEIITSILSNEFGEEWDFEAKTGRYFLFVS